MKRLALGFLLLLIAIIPVPYIPGGAAAKKPASVRIDKMIGQSAASIVKTYGKQARVDESEYPFSWYVFNNKDYKRFFMAGVLNGVVSAVYSNSKYMSFGSIKTGTTRAAVRIVFGAPVTSFRVGGTVYVAASTDKKDIFLYGGYYITFYYDVYDKYKVTSIMLVQKEHEEALLGIPLRLNGRQLSAYSRQSVDLVNAIRVRRGQKKLTLVRKYSDFAVYRSADMAKRRYFSHYTPEGRSPAYLAKKRGISFRFLCENIARGHRNAVSAFEAFMNSKGHRENILHSKVTNIGAGVTVASDNTVYVTYTMLQK